MAKKTKAKKVKKAKKANHSPALSTADRDWLAGVIASSLKGYANMLKKEPRSQKRRGQVTGGDR